VPSALTVRAVTEDEHLAHLRSRPSVSFLQTPAWGQVKGEWRRESLGWFRPSPDGSGAAGEEMVGAALVLYRRLPKVRRYLAYLPEGPPLDWAAVVQGEGGGSDGGLAAWLDPLTAHLRQRGAFGVRIGPPVVTRRWSAQQVKDGIADPAAARLADLAPTRREPVGAAVVSGLRDLGWRQQGTAGGFAAGQPQHVFQVPLVGADGTPRTEDEVLKGMNQLWRRNIKKAAKEGVAVDTVDTGDPGRLEAELRAFHELYVHTAERDHFNARPLTYFRTMADALGAEDPDRFRLFTARHEGDLVAATIAIRVGTHAWYSYGASSTVKREVRGSNAVQWAMILDALAAGAEIYDLRGITETLDPEDPHVGLIQFKVGTGGEAVEYAGEWDLPLNQVLYRAFDLYMSRR